MHKYYMGMDFEVAGEDVRLSFLISEAEYARVGLKVTSSQQATLAPVEAYSSLTYLEWAKRLEDQGIENVRFYNKSNGGGWYDLHGNAEKPPFLFAQATKAQRENYIAQMSGDPVSLIGSMTCITPDGQYVWGGYGHGPIVGYCHDGGLFHRLYYFIFKCVAESLIQTGKLCQDRYDFKTRVEYNPLGEGSSLQGFVVSGNDVFWKPESNGGMTRKSIWKADPEIAQGWLQELFPEKNLIQVDRFDDISL